MNISAKTEYACIAVLELAANYGSGEPVRIRKIAEAHGIPARFLVQILLQLKGAGLVSSTRGAAGGYRLVRDPESLTLAEVMELIDGKSQQLRSNACKRTPTSQALQKIWQEVAEQQREALSGISFAALVKRVRGETENMYYI